MNAEKVKKPNFVALMIVATVLLATAGLTMTTSGNAFAYSSNQAKSDINECGNGFVPTNVGCQNIDSQIQGDENSVAITAQQTFPAVVREEPTPPMETCEGCFDPLSVEQRAAFETSIPTFTEGRADTIEELCMLLEGLTEEQQLILIENIVTALINLSEPVEEETIVDIAECLARVLGIDIGT